MEADGEGDARHSLERRSRRTFWLALSFSVEGILSGQKEKRIQLHGPQTPLRQQLPVSSPAMRHSTLRSSWLTESRIICVIKVKVVIRRRFEAFARPGGSFWSALLDHHCPLILELTLLHHIIVVGHVGFRIDDLALRPSSLHGQLHLEDFTVERITDSEDGRRRRMSRFIVHVHIPSMRLFLLRVICVHPTR